MHDVHVQVSQICTDSDHGDLRVEYLRYVCTDWVHTDPTKVSKHK